MSTPHPYCTKQPYSRGEKTDPLRHRYIRAQLLQSTGSAPHVQIGRKMQAVQRVFKRKYSMNDGSQWRTDFEDSFSDGQVFRIGCLNAHVLHLARGNMAFVIGQHIFAGSSTFDLEVRNRHERLLGSLESYHIYSSGDSAPTRSLKLTPVLESERAKFGGKKLVIKYEAQ